MVVIRLSEEGKREATAPVRAACNTGRQGGDSPRTTARASDTKATVLHNPFIVRNSNDAKNDAIAKEVTQ